MFSLLQTEHQIKNNNQKNEKRELTVNIKDVRQEKLLIYRLIVCSLIVSDTPFLDNAGY